MSVIIWVYEEAEISVVLSGKFYCLMQGKREEWRKYANAWKENKSLQQHGKLIP